MFTVLLVMIIDETLRAAWWRFVRLWRPMAAWTLLTWVLLGLVLVPLTSSVVSSVFFRGERVMVGNEDLLAWFLRPEGLAYLIVAGALSIMAAVARFAGLFRMIVDDVNARTVSVRQTILELVTEFPAVVRLCLATAMSTIVLLVPLITGLMAIYAGLLGEYDINYYLDARPPEWNRALVAAAGWTLLWGAGAAYVLLLSLVTFPAYLDGHRPARAALRQSWSLSRGDTLRMLRIILVCLGIWLAGRALLHAAFYYVAVLAAERVALVVSSLTPLLLVSAGFAAGTVVLDATLSFVGFSVLATMLVKFYLEDTPLHASARVDPLEPRRLAPTTITTIRRWLHPARALPALALAAGLVLVFSGYLLDDLPEQPNIVVTAHRAGGHLATENTLAALERSIEAGADYVEIDVQTTRDSIVVVTHDADLMRLAADPRRIAKTNYEHLRDVVLGQDGGEVSERRLATLETFIERAKGRIGLNIELKYYGANPYLGRRVVELLRTHELSASADAMIMSLDLDAVRRVRELAPEIEIGYVAAVTAGDATRLPVDFLAVSQRLATDRLLRTARRRGLDVHVWTLNEPGSMLQMIERGVDGIITDDPALAVRVIEELSTLTALERLLLSFQPLLLDTDAMP